MVTLFEALQDAHIPLITSVAIWVLAVIGAVSLARRVGEWPLWVMAGLIAIVSISQVSALVRDILSIDPALAPNTQDTLRLFASLLAVIAVFYTERLVRQRDDTEEKRQENEDRLNVINANLPGTVFRRIRHADGSITCPFVSAGAERLFGYDPRELMTESGLLLDTIHPDDRPIWQSAEKVSAMTLEPFDVEFRIILPSGKVPWIRSIAVPHRLEDGSVVWDGITLDITDGKKAQMQVYESKRQAELANRAKSEFLANMSHELRTPLNAVIGFSELIKNQSFGPVGNTRYVDYSSAIYESGVHLLDLVNDILDLSKIEAGRFDLEEENVDVAEVIGSVICIVLDRAKATGLTLENNTEPDMPAIRGDGRAVKQILINLLSNAIKFTPSGGHVTIAWRISPDGHPTLSVADTGIGIEPNDLERILVPFGQVESALVKKHEGSGLGLTLTNRLVDLHGGRLEIESKVGEGSTFKVRFPRERIVRDALPEPVRSAGVA